MPQPTLRAVSHIVLRQHETIFAEISGCEDAEGVDASEKRSSAIKSFIFKYILGQVSVGAFSVIFLFGVASALDVYLSQLILQHYLTKRANSSERARSAAGVFVCVRV
jgi:hypothetical protein